MAAGNMNMCLMYLYDTRVCTCVIDCGLLMNVVLFGVMMMDDVFVVVG